MANARVRLFNNLEGISEVLGVLRDWSTRMSNEEYLHNVVDKAYDGAEEAFNLAAAASASAMNFSHMYEFGTEGVADGDGTPLSPLSPAARLWRTKKSGNGSNINIDFDFRPAVKRNPWPPRNAKIDPKYLKKVKRWKHVFWNKAAVVEGGMDVTIKPKADNPSGMLFVPILPHWTFKNDKGFVMLPEVNNNPVDDTHTGRFSAFWTGWWAGQGREEVLQRANRQVNDHVRWYNNTAERRAKKAGGMKEATKVNVINARRRAQGEIAKQAAAEFRRMK